jgi:hypothetical protein
MKTFVVTILREKTVVIEEFVEIEVEAANQDEAMERALQGVVAGDGEDSGEFQWWERDELEVWYDNYDACFAEELDPAQ